MQNWNLSLEKPEAEKEFSSLINPSIQANKFTQSTSKGEKIS